MTGTRGSVGFSSTYRPQLSLDIFSCPAQQTTVLKQDEVHMSDGVSYNYSGCEIPSAALKTILERPLLVESEYNVDDVDSGALTGLVFVSERDRGLETVHIAIHLRNGTPKVFSLADLFATFNGVRMEDSSSIAPGGGGGDYLIYVTTKDQNAVRRQPWTAIYKTKLTTGETTRLTPVNQADLSPSVHPSGTKIAVASFEKVNGLGWDGAIEDLQTDIFVMNVEAPFERRRVITNGGWPTWGGNDILFFHRKVGDNWRVYKAENIGGCAGSVSIGPVTPPSIDAMTPAAINATTVAVATIRNKSKFGDVRTKEQYRHIEIFQYNSAHNVTNIQITQQIRPLADHFNPFVVGGGKRIGYHRSKINDKLKCTGDTQNHSNKIACPYPDIDMFRVPGIFPTFSKDGSKLAFVDNEFKKVWVADSEGLRIVYEIDVPGNLFCPVWNQNFKKDEVYVCHGPSFNADQRIDIIAIPIHKDSKGKYTSNRHHLNLTTDYNNAFPSTNKEGTKLVFRSTMNMISENGIKSFGKEDTRYKNLYIMNDIHKGAQLNNLTRLTNEKCIETHCQWSPSGDWIVFASSRDNPNKIDPSDNGLDPGFFAVFLVKADDPAVCVRVAASASNIAGHVNHPFFSPDGMSIVVASDLAGVSADPISLPLFVHSVRPYGDIFIIDINPHDIMKNKDVRNFRRITHSRFENSTASWTRFSTHDPKAAWNQLLNMAFSPLCPHLHPGGGETWYNTGHLCIPKRCC